MLTKPVVQLKFPDGPALPAWYNFSMSMIWIAAGIGIFLPFALGISPLDALLLRIPNESNWWHVLVGFPFFLCLPMIWVRVHLLNSAINLNGNLLKTFWTLIYISAVGTVLVEFPFLIHKAGTSEFQRLEVIFLGLGVLLSCFLYLLKKRKTIHPTLSLIIAITCAYLANAFLCLIVYGEKKFQNQPRSGWYLTLEIAIALIADLIWLFIKNQLDRRSYS